MPEPADPSVPLFDLLRGKPVATQGENLSAGKVGLHVNHLICPDRLSAAFPVQDKGKPGIGKAPQSLRVKQIHDFHIADSLPHHFQHRGGERAPLHQGPHLLQHLGCQDSPLLLGISVRDHRLLKTGINHIDSIVSLLLHRGFQPPEVVRGSLGGNLHRLIVHGKIRRSHPGQHKLRKEPAGKHHHCRQKNPQEA